MSSRSAGYSRCLKTESYRVRRQSPTFLGYSSVPRLALPLLTRPQDGMQNYYVLPGAGEGLQPDHGKRRSVRQHCRPLEWWRSEKKVYTRQYRSACPALLPGADPVEESCR